MLDLHVFIISWKGQHTKAERVANELVGVARKVSIVYSDSDPSIKIHSECQTIKTNNNLFWADKFRTCLENLDENADNLLIIHADCECDDWPGLAKASSNAHSQYPRIGVWAPQINFTPYQLKNTLLGNFFSTPMKIVAQTDGIVFSLSRQVIRRMKTIDYSQNKYGWGIDWIFIAYTYANKLFAVVDPRVHVKHPKSQSYPKDIALNMMNEFLKQLGPSERIQYALLSNYIYSMNIQNAIAAHSKKPN